MNKKKIMKSGNIYSGIGKATPDEIFDSIFINASGRVERIISNGQATPEGEWYDQDKDEWVLLLQGSAGVLLEGEDEPVILLPGDYLLLPARCRHRVAWTDQKTQTVWLAVHM